MITIQYLKVIIIIRKNHIHFRIHLTLNPNDTNTFKIIYIKVLKIIYQNQDLRDASLIYINELLNQNNPSNT